MGTLMAEASVATRACVGEKEEELRTTEGWGADAWIGWMREQEVGAESGCFAGSEAESPVLAEQGEGK
jgi:hypothetical protein